MHILDNHMIYLHVDLFKCIYQKSNDKEMTLPKDTDLTLFLDDK